MHYVSTRGGVLPVVGAEAIVRGLDENGGLFVPEHFPSISAAEQARLMHRSYPEVAAHLLSALLSDFPPPALLEMTRAAYARFAMPEVAPLRALSGGVSVLELFHGPTLAFKDIALTLLPHLLTASGKLCGQSHRFLSLVATSGDTGKAALSGFADVPGTSCLVYYPRDGVSTAQRLQMTTQRGNNVHVVAVNGNFDDAQTGVKAIFTNRQAAEALRAQGFVLSSANSINWGRLAPQIVYYFTAYFALCLRGAIRPGDEVNFAVPTGNFGDILAGVYAKRMGLPVGRLICASNQNNILTDFLNTGIYDTRRAFHLTSSPSMDILISSNLERLLFDACGRDAARLSGWMRDLKERGVYQVEPDALAYIQSCLAGHWCSEARVCEEIARTWQEEGYLLDPHTAVAMAALRDERAQTGDTRPCVVLATASPFKFGRAVAEALFGAPQAADDFALCARISQLTGLPVPEAIRELAQLPVRHTRVCERDNMLDALLAEMKNE